MLRYFFLLLFLSTLTLAKEGTVCYRFHLNERNIDELKTIVRDIGSLNPSHSFALGHPPHLSHEEVADLIGRTEDEIHSLQRDLIRINGRVEHVGPLRDNLKACFDVHPLLKSSTRKMLSAAKTSRKMALSTFSSHLQPSSSRLLRAVEHLPLSATQKELYYGPRNAVPESAERATQPAASWSYLYPLYRAGKDGLMETEKRPGEAPVTFLTELMAFNNAKIGIYNYGIYSPAQILRQPALVYGFAFALPAAANDDGTTFASRVVPFNLTFYYNLTDAATFKRTMQYSIQINQSHPAVRTMAFGDALSAARKNGPADVQQFFPSDLAEQFRANTAKLSNRSNDFSNDTMLFVVDISKAGLPMYMGLWNLGMFISVQLEDGVRAVTNGTFPLGTGSPLVNDNGPNFVAPFMNFTNWPNGQQQAAKSLFVAVAENFQTYAYNPQDLAIASAAFNITNPSVVDLLDPPYFVPNTPETCGPYNNMSPEESGFCIEPSVDIQLIAQYSAGSGATIAFASPNASLANALPEPYPFLMYEHTKPMPNVLSLSYDGDESEDDIISDIAILKAAALGMTVVTSSGDVGAAATPNGACTPGKKLQPQYLASSEWATSVGALQMVRPTLNSSLVLTAAMSSAGSVITSGGGFSGLYPQPTWQAKYVKKFLNYSSNSPYYPKNGAAQNFFPNNRGYPDLSAFGWSVPYMSGLMPTMMAGSSASAPIVAGVVMQLNAAIRATPGLENETLGYATRFWYWAADNYPNAFTDVVTGGNQFNGRSAVQDCGVGFEATPGWDAVTGLGMPNVGILSQAAIRFVTIRKSMAANLTDVAITLGSNQFGQLGYGTASGPRKTARHLGGKYRGAPWKTATAGQAHACGILMSDSTMRCWGRGTSCQLGTGNCTNEYLPTPLGGEFINAKWASVVGGGDFTCGLTEGQRRAYCWGSNQKGQLADGKAVPKSSIPVPMGTPEWAATSWTSVTAGTRHACGIKKSDSALFCWGDNILGQLGIGSKSTSMTLPTAVLPGTQWTAVAAGGEHTCAIRSKDKALLCWGSNGNGGLGIGNSTVRSAFSPAPVSLADTVAAKSNSSMPWTEVTAGVMHSCGTLNGKHTYCWGSNKYGQLGTGNYSSASAPRLVDTPSTIVLPFHKTNAGQYATCALSKHDHVYCWGSLAYGVLTQNNTVPYPYYISGTAPLYTYKEAHVGGGFLIALHADKK